MSEPTLYKRAFTLGLNNELLRAGAVQYPSQAHADAAADYVAKHANFPDPVTHGQELTLEVAHNLCRHLKTASEALCKEAGVYDTQLSKTASASTPVEIAAQEAFALMQKVALENETPNTAEQAAMHDGMARLDIMQRPPGYAVAGAGGALPPEGEGELGAEKDVALAPEKVANALRGALAGGAGGAALGAAGGAIAGGEGHRLEGAGMGALAGGALGAGGGALAGHNVNGVLGRYGELLDAGATAISQMPNAEKAPAFAAMLQGTTPALEASLAPQARLLAGSALAGGALGTGAGALAGSAKEAAAAAGTNTTGPNTLPVAAKTDSFAALDLKNRPQGYAHHRVSDKVPAGATTGAEVPVGPKKTAAQILFDKTAKLVVPFLPEKMPDIQKIAHINAMSTLGSRGKAKYLNNMYVSYGADKTASLTYAEAFYKTASECESEEEEYEVAKAFEHAAENLEDQTEAHTADHAEEVADKTAAAMARLTAAAQRITQ